jgi:predicted small metal-binding protein
VTLRGAAGTGGPLEFRCADVGVVCRNVARADDEEQLLTAVGEHARVAHGVELNDTLREYARSKVRSSGQGPAHAG